MQKRVTPLPIAARLADLAMKAPEDTVLTEPAANGEWRMVSYHELLRDVRTLSESISVKRRTYGREIVVCYPARPTVETVIAILAALCAEVPVFPHSPRLDGERLSAVLEKGNLSLLPKGIDGTGALGQLDAMRIASWSSGEPARRPVYLLATSGSTSTPKLVPFWNLGHYDPRAIPDLVFRSCGWTPGQRQLLALPPNHIAPFAALIQGVLDENHLVLAGDLTADDTVDAIVRWGVEWLMLTPNHMQRLLPHARCRSAELTQVRGLLHTALPCPPGLKNDWIDLLPSARVYEMYGGTEGVGVTVIDGAEWQRRPGSVGRGLLTSVRVQYDDGSPAPHGAIGRVFLKRLGASGPRPELDWLETTSDGYRSLGDVGWVDGDGYLYVFDRAANAVVAESGVAWLGRTSLVLRGHPGLLDAECVTLGDDEQQVIGAMVVARDGIDVDLRDVHRHCVEYLATFERPQIYLRVSMIPRSDLGKVDAVAIRAEFDQLCSTDTESVLRIRQEGSL